MSKAVEVRGAARFQGAQVTVMGFGLFGGGAATAHWLLEAGARVTVTDLRTAEELAPALETWSRDRPAGPQPNWILGQHRGEDFTEADWVVANPAVAPDHELLVAARSAGTRVTSEMELFLECCCAQVVLVTGTQGKSSTAHILAQMLEHAGKPVVLGGNIGRSLLRQAAEMDEDTIAVVEISSYQLEALSADAGARCNVRAVAITNILADHLERHGTVEAYGQAKARVLELLDSNGVAVVPTSLAGRAESIVMSAARIITHGRDAADLHVAAGCFWAGDSKLGAVQDLALPGTFQVDNTLVALGLAQELGCLPETLAASLCELLCLEFRMQPLGQINGVQVVDNGVSTTPDSTLAALQGMVGPCTLLLGGQAKRGLAWEKLANRVTRAGVHVVAFGASRDEIQGAMTRAGAECETASDLSAATRRGLEATPRPGTLLFSPACASFDAYLNFRQRALCFRELLAELETQGVGG